MHDTTALPEWVLARINVNIEAVMSLGAGVVREEMDLYTTKWLDYRFISPTEATDMFKSEYNKAYKIAWRTYEDRNEAEFKSGLFEMPKFRKPSDKDTIKLKREYTSIWRARQCADALGVPYDFLIRETIDALMASGRCRTMPRPNQIAGALTDEAIRDRVRQQWTDWAAFNFSSMISRLPQYMDHAYRGLHAQDAHRDWVLSAWGTVTRGTSVAPAIFSRLCPKIVLLRVLARSGLRRLDEVKGETPAATAELEPGQLAPSCFAVPFAFEKNNGSAWRALLGGRARRWRASRVLRCGMHAGRRPPKSQGARAGNDPPATVPGEKGRLAINCDVCCQYRTAGGPNSPSAWAGGRFGRTRRTSLADEAGEKR